VSILPSAKEIESFKAAFAVQHPLLNDCWATMDGLKLYLQQSAKMSLFKSSITMDGCMTTCHICIFFCPDGMILIVVFVNTPGSAHDSQVVQF
jgi:hypothetical protein